MGISHARLPGMSHFISKGLQNEHLIYSNLYAASSPYPLDILYYKSPLYLLESMQHMSQVPLGCGTYNTIKSIEVRFM